MTGENHWQQPERNGPTTAPQDPLWQQPYLNEHPTHLVKSSDEGDRDDAAKWRHKLEYLKEMIVGVDILLVFIVVCVVTFCVNQIGNKWISFLSEYKPAITTLGAFYSFALVFRTNICYSRW
jgi:hypothetical protein